MWNIIFYPCNDNRCMYYRIKTDLLETNYGMSSSNLIKCPFWVACQLQVARSKLVIVKDGLCLYYMRKGTYNIKHEEVSLKENRVTWIESVDHIIICYALCHNNSELVEVTLLERDQTSSFP